MRNIKWTYCLIVVLVITFLSVGYSAFEKDLVASDITGVVRIEKDIRVTNVSLVENSNGSTVGLLDYDVDKVIANINMPNINSIFEISVTVTNFGFVDMYTNVSLPFEYKDIFEISFDGFENGELIDYASKTKTFNIIISYKDNASVINGDITDFYINFDFSVNRFHWGEYEYTGFDLIEIIDSSSDNLKMKISPMNGAYDRFVIPIINLDVGSYYVIDFTENKTLLSGKSYQNDSKTYTYGTTVTIKSIDEEIGTKSESFILPEYFNYDNNPLHTSFMWKEPFLETDYAEGRSYDVPLTFYAAESTMYWMWDFANINNSVTIEFELSNISLRKIEYPETEPYIRFVDTTFNTWTYDTDYETEGTQGSAEDDKEQDYLRYSYRTGATGDELDLRVETGVGWEFFNIPLKNLTTNKKYRITYNVNTTPTALTINTTNVYGSLVQASAATSSKQIITQSDSSKSNVSIINEMGSYSDSIEFTATASTMYWVWQCGGINNFQWANIKLTNVVLEEVN